MKDLGITKGEWRESDRFGGLINSVDEINMTESIADITAKYTLNETNANTVLICDAGNTAQKCGLLPSELLKQRDELLNLVKLVHGSFGGGLVMTFNERDVENFKQAIKNATK